MTTSRLSPKRQPKPTKKRERIRHLHVVIDDDLNGKLEHHAIAIDPVAGLKAKRTGRAPNVSAAVRDLLRKALGILPAKAA